ncbi:MAG: hypothetical protein D6686_16655 [Alphaproteobacteria bacterium]|nr:MAG: hypothetical protein D6686_16655 [Alphaproteobacteria bacterium]
MRLLARKGPMIEILKILHFLAMGIGVGGGFAQGIIGRRTVAAEPAARELLGAIQRRISVGTAIALAVLWITGIWMTYAIHGGFTGQPTSFWLKIATVAVLTLIVMAMGHTAARAAAAGGTPPPGRMAALGGVAQLATALAVVLAVLTFT